jgi:UDP-N-acetylmuramate--alanine ligase
MKGIAVAGTHGKTTTSTMIAHLLSQSGVGCSAFLGGISKNYGTNLLLNEKSDIVVVEADEYDRSFLRLYPHLAIVTSVDADHLDIYGTHEEVVKSFEQFIKQINPEGILIYKKSIGLNTSGLGDVTVFNYSLQGPADFYPYNIEIENGLYVFDVQTPMGIIEKLMLGIGGRMNLENAIAAIAAACMLGVKPNEIRAALESFSGVKRRFDVHIKTPGFVYIDDYAHHPEELAACIQSVKALFPNKKVTGIFQPHLFTRTRDFAAGFAQSLGMLDELILLEIYPAREEPIPGITSEIIFDKVEMKNKWLCKKENLFEVLASKTPEVLITMGAGNIDTLPGPICQWAKTKFKTIN